MVMRQMRENTKWIMLILTVAFVGWLVLDWVRSRQTGGGSGPNPVIAKVDGQDIHYAEWNQLLQNALDQARQGSSDALTDEQTRQVKEQAWNQMINEILMQHEMDRLGISVSDKEIREAFRTSPPPSLMRNPAFQTNGQFDYEKYKKFFSSPGVNQQLLLQIENYYRATLPREKLYRWVSEGVYPTDAELWRVYRDRSEKVVVDYVSVDPDRLVPDSAVQVSDSEVSDYYSAHRNDFRRPATASVDLVSLQVAATAADSARARTEADSIRRLVGGRAATFDSILQATASDSTSGIQGGSLGRMAKGDFDSPALEAAAFSTPVGEVSRPVAGPSGYELVRVSSRKGDTVRVSHLTVPVRTSRATEDSVFGLMDRVEGVALRKGLKTAGDSVGVPVRTDVTLTKGSEFVPGAGALGVGVDWAFDPQTSAGDVSEFYQNASGYHMIELEGRTPAGTYSLDEVRPQIRSLLAKRRKKALAMKQVEAARKEIASGKTLAQVAGEHGWTLRTSDPFTRVGSVPGLGQGTEALGVAFGLKEGKVSPAVDAGENVALVRLDRRIPADESRFKQIEPQLRSQLTLQDQQQRYAEWIASLRQQAKIEDLRDEVLSSRSS